MASTAPGPEDRLDSWKEIAAYLKRGVRTVQRWERSSGLTADKMKECRWLKPVLVGQVEFVEWTPDGHLRHSRFVALTEDRDTRDVRRENYE